MGRAKLQIKYREDVCARRSTYTTRMKSMKKKASELSLLCGVDVLVASFSPELNAVECWPKKETVEFRRIRERYLYSRKKKSNCDCNGSGDERNDSSQLQNPCLPLSSSSLSMPLFQEEMAAMEIKLKEVRERLQFLQSYSHDENLVNQLRNEEEQFTFNVSVPSQQVFQSYEPSSQFSYSVSPNPAHLNMSLPEDLLHSLEQTSQFEQSLCSPFVQCFPAYPADFNMPLEQDLYPLESYFLFAQSLTPLKEASPFAESLPSHLVDFNMPLQQDLLYPLEPYFPSVQSLTPLDQAFPFAQSLPSHLTDFHMPLQQDLLYPFE